MTPVKLKQKLAIRYVRAQLNILSLVSMQKAAIKAFRLFCTPQQRASGKYPAIFERGEKLSFLLEGHMVRGHRWAPGPDGREGGGAKSSGNPRSGKGSAIPGDGLGKKILIAHGFESSSRTFDPYIGALLERGYEVVAFDAPAHGRSGGRRILLTSYVTMLRSIMDNYGSFDAWLGHSLGGLALVLALEDMQIETGARLVLIAPAVETTAAVEAFAGLLHLPKAVVHEMDNYVEEISGHRFSWYSLRRAIGQIRADILYVQDEKDQITPLKDALVVKRDGHPNIRFLFTIGLGHRKIYKDPEMIRQIVEFF
jgi:pimeloyl-ACP methyl ester carboxylesterase